MNRRELLKAGFAAGAIGLAPRLASADVDFTPTPKGWRTFELTTRVEPTFADKAWIPLPTFAADDWQRPGNVSWTGNAKVAERVGDPKYGAEMLRVEWARRSAEPGDRGDDAGAGAEPLAAARPGIRRAAQRRRAQVQPARPPTCCRSTAWSRRPPTASCAARTKDVDKARALYEWVVENTFRNPKTKGCGVGDVSWMIKTGNLNGKCADLNALYVAMARSVGLPARDVYGIRVVPSQFGYKSLGAGSEIVTKAQHCRAEVWLEGSGWTPVDPADVRKVVLEEPPANLALSDLKVLAARKTLFGAWEGNWLAFNIAHDVKLPGSSEPPLPFLMYPQAADKSGLVDPLDPDAFKYKITARELIA